MTSDENANPETGEPIEETPESGAQTASEADRIAELEAEITQLHDRLLRAAAEMENLRKRTERELKETKSYAIANFARDMLVATDNLSRALLVLPQEVRDNAEGTFKSLVEGIEMTEREMQRLLGKHGVVPIAAQGEKFDPHQHQAMFEVPDATVPEGTVVQVVQDGYAIGERVLRPAMVGVSKGGPRRGAEPGNGADLGPDTTEPGEGVDKSA